MVRPEDCGKFTEDEEKKLLKCEEIIDFKLSQHDFGNDPKPRIYVEIYSLKVVAAIKKLYEEGWDVSTESTSSGHYLTFVAKRSVTYKWPEKMQATLDKLAAGKAMEKMPVLPKTEVGSHERVYNFEQ